MIKKSSYLIRNFVSTVLFLIGAALIIGAVSWSAYTTYKFKTYAGVAEGKVIEYYAPIKNLPDYKWPKISYSVGGKEYLYEGKSEVSEKPYPESMSLVIRYDIKQPSNAVTSLDFYDGLKFSAFGLVGALIILFMAKLLSPNEKEEGSGSALSGETGDIGRISYSENEDTSAVNTITKGHFNEISGELMYVISPGVYASGWQNIDGEWYFFDPDNHNACVRKQWKKLGGDIFCFREDGSILKGWYTDGGYWFFLNPVEKYGRIGKLFTGWVQMGQGGAISYFNESDTTLPIGAMFIDRLAPGNLKVDAEGKYYLKNDADIPVGTFVFQ